jgi:hypothetical protein
MGVVVKVPSRGQHQAWPGVDNRLQRRAKLASNDNGDSVKDPSGTRAEPDARPNSCSTVTFAPQKHPGAELEQDFDG